MRTTTRLGGLISTIVLGTVLLSPPSFAANSLTVSCTAASGSISYPSGTGEVAVAITLSDGTTFEHSVSVAPGKSDFIMIINTTPLAMVTIDASAFSKKGKLFASSSATC